MPERDSAICWASAAGMVTGDMAPMSRKGVMITGWFAAVYSNCESSMRSSQRSGELQLTREMQKGFSSIEARPPKTMSPMARVSRALRALTTLPMMILSV